MTAERAYDLGLINRLVPEAQLEKTVEDLIAKVTAQSGPVLTMAKKAILGSVGVPLREGVRNSMKIFLNELSDLEESLNPAAKNIFQRRATILFAATFVAFSFTTWLLTRTQIGSNESHEASTPEGVIRMQLDALAQGELQIA